MWIDTCEQKFETLRDWPTSAPILSFPDYLDDFVVCSNVSGIGLGCILKQRGRMIAYASR